MKVFKYVKKVAPVLALAMAALFAGCSNSSDGGGTPRPEGFYPTSGMTKTQTVSVSSATNGTIAVNNDTKTLVITGAAGKSFYIVSSNIRNASITMDNMRYAAPQAQASVESQANLQYSFDPQKKDPRALLEERILENISKARFSKNAAPAIQFEQQPDVGAKVEFFELQDREKDLYEKKEYVLFESNADYNLWVKVGDPFDKDDFRTRASKAGEKFIQGYNLVKHIYGEPSSKLWIKDASGKHIERGNMADLSLCGEKINIMFLSMLKDLPETKLRNLNGFVVHSDNYDNGVSNRGRFLYIDSSLVLEDRGTLNFTMLHEFSHAISYNQKTIKNNIRWTYWYGEMLAMLCEDMMQDYLGVRDTDIAKNIEGSLGSTPKNRLSLANQLGSAYGLTGGDAEVYAEAYELGAWLARRFGGIKLVKELATNAKVDWDSIVSAVNAVNGTSHTIQSLMALFAGDLLKQETNAGLNQDAPKYQDDQNLYYIYNDDQGQHKYLYPFTAIDLWNANHFYDWYKPNMESLIQNKKSNFADLPDTNIYKMDYAQNPPQNAYVGPADFKRNTKNNLGPYGQAFTSLEPATQDTISITFCCDGPQFGDTLTIYIK